MYIDPYYKVVQLKSFIGEKKLKQLGLLHCQSCPPLSMVEQSASSKNTLPSTEYIPISLANASAEDIIQEVLDKHSPTTSIYKPSTFHQALYPFKEELDENAEDILLCPECGKRYHSLDSQLYEPLPLALSDVESDAIKGIFVDLYL